MKPGLIINIITVAFSAVYLIVEIIKMVSGNKKLMLIDYRLIGMYVFFMGFIVLYMLVNSGNESLALARDISLMVFAFLAIPWSNIMFAKFKSL